MAVPAVNTIPAFPLYYTGTFDQDVATWGTALEAMTGEYNASITAFNAANQAGLGAGGSAVLADLDALDTPGGHHRTDATTLNRPAGVSFASVIVMRMAAGVDSFQQVIIQTGGIIGRRSCLAGVFGDWYFNKQLVTLGPGAVASVAFGDSVVPFTIARGADGSSGNLSEAGTFIANLGDTPELIKTSTGDGSGITIEPAGTVLNGANGTGAIMNISAAAGRLYIHNPRGFTATYTIKQLGE